MSNKWTIKSKPVRLEIKDIDKEAYQVVVEFHIREDLTVKAAHGIYLEIPAGGGAKAFSDALDEHWDREVKANTPVDNVSSDILELVSSHLTTGV